MEEIKFVGENLAYGFFGNLFIALAFAAALLSAAAYLGHHLSGEKDSNWKKIARFAFMAHSAGVLGIVITLFLIMGLHRFEYHYAFQHTSRELPFRYIFAAFWEGQEGSFLLWTFWHVVIGNILLRTSKTWEAPVMTIFSLVQVFLVSMVVGAVIYLPDLGINYKIGSNPFLLTREHPTMVNMPFVKIPTYLATLNGRGLNPALQNYWMTIHPPTLFLGFALTLVPYAYAVAGIWKRELNGWTKPAIPWAFVGVMVLGGGILMGGAWAYEALNFGGFWAWDPVENSSLVPWLCLAAGAHLMLINKSRGATLLAGIVFTALAFILVLYSTFLTRSGILGDASVHSFTDMGMQLQLLLFMAFFIWLPGLLALPTLKWKAALIAVTALVLGIAGYFQAIGWVLLAFLLAALAGSLFLKRLELVPSNEKKDDDRIDSREFWMFAGALVLITSALHLIVVTSTPVINKGLGTKYAPAAIDDYNLVQSAIAIILTLLIAVGQYFRYRKTDMKEFWKKIFRSLILAGGGVVAAGLIFKEFNQPLYIILALTSGFAFLANLDYIIQFVKTKWKLAGASIAHIGFSLIILGSVVAAGHKKIISQNSGFIDLQMLNEEFKNNENVMLPRNTAFPMGDYYVVYRGDTLRNNVAYYQVDYLRKNAQTQQLEPAFTLYPKIITSRTMGNVAEPSTKHFLDKDIFTFVTYADLDRLKQRVNPGAHKLEFNEPQHVSVEKKDTIFGTNFYVIFNGFEALSSIDELDEHKSLNIKLRGVFIVKDLAGMSDTLRPIFEVKDNYQYSNPAFSETSGLKISVEKILDDKKIEVAIAELKNHPRNDFIIMQAIVFPGINILWVGCFLMVFGTALAVLRRLLK